MARGVVHFFTRYLFLALVVFQARSASTASDPTTTTASITNTPSYTLLRCPLGTSHMHCAWFSSTESSCSVDYRDLTLVPSSESTLCYQRVLVTSTLTNTFCICDGQLRCVYQVQLTNGSVKKPRRNLSECQTRLPSTQSVTVQQIQTTAYSHETSQPEKNPTILPDKSTSSFSAEDAGSVTPAIVVFSKQTFSWESEHHATAVNVTGDRNTRTTPQEETTTINHSTIRTNGRNLSTKELTRFAIIVAIAIPLIVAVAAAAFFKRAYLRDCLNCTCHFNFWHNSVDFGESPIELGSNNGQGPTPTVSSQRPTNPDVNPLPDCGGDAPYRKESEAMAEAVQEEREPTNPTQCSEKFKKSDGVEGNG